MSLNGSACIVGAYEHPTRKADDLSVVRLHADVAKGADPRAGMELLDGRGRLVENEDCRLAHQASGDLDTLLLSPANQASLYPLMTSPTAAQRMAKALGKRHKERMGDHYERILARLRRRDRRYRLAIKSKMPWDYWWIWRKPEERVETERLFHRLHDDPVVAGAVTLFDARALLDPLVLQV